MNTHTRTNVRHLCYAASETSPSTRGRTCPSTCQVRKIFASRRAFAALREDGRVVTWGDGAFGGDSSDVQVGPVVRVRRTTGGDGWRMRLFSFLGEDGDIDQVDRPRMEVEF